MSIRTITCKSIIDAKVFSDFSYFHNFVLGSRKTGFIAGSLALAVTAFLNLLTGSPLLFFICIGLAAGVPALYYFFYKRLLSNQIKKNDLQTPREAYTIIIDEKGVTASTDSEKTSYPWNKVFRIYRTPDYFYIYIVKNKAFILPIDNIRGATPDALWTYIQGYTKNTKYY